MKHNETWSNAVDQLFLLLYSFLSLFTALQSSGIPMHQGYKREAGCFSFEAVVVPWHDCPVRVSAC